jgi:hypothetical protein
MFGCIALNEYLKGNIGGGSGGGVLVVHKDENGTLDHTVQEIFDAPFAVLDESDEPDAVKSICTLKGVTIEEGEEFSCTFIQGSMQLYFTAQSADGYPTYTDAG